MSHYEKLISEATRLQDRIAIGEVLELMQRTAGRQFDFLKRPDFLKLAFYCAKTLGF